MGPGRQSSILDSVYPRRYLITIRGSLSEMFFQRVLTFLGRWSRPAQPRPSHTPAPEERLRSPVPWIADEVWTCWIDARAAEPYRETLVSPGVIVVSDDDRQRSTHESGKVDRAAPQLEPEDAARCFSTLQRTPSSHATTFSPLWPICCRQLATLINAQGEGIDICEIEAAYGPLDRTYLEYLVHPAARSRSRARRRFEARVSKDLREMRRWGLFGGILIFKCPTCGRHYLSTCIP